MMKVICKWTEPDRRARLRHARQMADVVSADFNMIKQLAGVATCFTPHPESGGRSP